MNHSADLLSTSGGATPIWRRLYVQVMTAILLGAVLGYLSPSLGEAMRPLSDAFIKLVKMVIAPVIFLTLTTGIAGMRNLGRVGGVAGKAFAYFLTVSSLALLVGLAVANLVQPGAGMNIDPATLDPGSVQAYARSSHDLTVTGFLMDIIPSSVAGAFVDGNLLQVLFFAIPFGLALAALGDRATPVLIVLETLSETFFRLVAMFMRAAPIGAFGAFAFTIGKYGVGTLANLAALVATFYLTSILFVVAVLGLVSWSCGFSIFRLLRYLRDELVLVLGTSSSEAALPSLLAKLERAGCPKPVVGLVAPLGYSFNLDGTNIYMTLAALFIAQALNIDLSLQEQLLLLGVAMLSSKGAAGVTGAGFITLAATLSIVPSVPLAGIALILGVDRFMSECRALTNFVGNAVATIVVSRWDGGLDRAALARALASNPEKPAGATGPGLPAGLGAMGSMHISAERPGVSASANSVRNVPDQALLAGDRHGG